MQTFHDRLAHLRNDIVGQGDRVLDITLKAVECYFDGDRAKASAVIAADEEIDRLLELLPTVVATLRASNGLAP